MLNGSTAPIVLEFAALPEHIRGFGTSRGRTGEGKVSLAQLETTLQRERFADEGQVTT